MIGIVVVSYGSADLLRENLGTLDRGRLGEPGAVVVVDNMRTPPDRAAVLACVAAHDWDVVLNPGNAGFGSAANQGVRRAVGQGCDVVVVVNPDVRAEPATIAALASAAREHPRALVSPRVVRPDGRDWFTGGEVDVVRGRTRNVVAAPGPQGTGWLTGACLAAGAEVWAELGGFDEDYVLYWEDVDLCHRWTAAGGRLVVRHDLTVVHAVGGTQGEGKSAAYVRYNCRNRLLFAAKHLDRRAARRWLPRSPAYAWDVVRRSGRRHLLRHPGLLVAALRGTVQGAAAVLGRSEVLGRSALNG